MKASDAVALALMVYPSAERFIELHSDERAPFSLRESYLHQENLPLTQLQFKSGGAKLDDPCRKDGGF